MSDLISRQKALDGLEYEMKYGAEIDRCGLDTAYDIIENVPSVEPERTVKVEQAVPSMTILKRKVDLQSILQAIKTDKIRVWLNYDGKICFRNTKTGNEISVYPYYDMNGEKFDE